MLIFFILFGTLLPTSAFGEKIKGVEKPKLSADEKIIFEKEEITDQNVLLERA